MKIALACYENDDLMDDVAAADAAAAEAAAAEAAAAAAAAAAKKKEKGPKVFTQDDVNRFLSEDRRKHVQKLEQLEGAYKDALANQNLSKEQREQLESKLEDLQKTFRSREQQLEHDKKELEERYGKEVKDWEAKATKLEQKYKQTVIDRALQDAAVVNDAFNISQIVALLRPMTVMVEKTDDQGQSTGEASPWVDLTDIDIEGNPIITRKTPEAAVKRMKELTSLFGNLFKSNVVSGIGAGTATGGNASGSGVADVKKMSAEEYMRRRKENPTSLGLKPR